MADVKKILITGDYSKLNITNLLSKIENLGIKAEILNLLQSEKNNKEKFKTQIELESKKIIELQNNNNRHSALIVIGGILDYSLMIDNSNFLKILTENKLNNDLIRNSYDAVICLKSPQMICNGQYESIISLWVGTEHLRIVDFSDELRLFKEIKAVLGIPKPIEIERKLLIEKPSDEILSNLKLCRKIPITQAYLKTPEETKFRIRKRGAGENSMYIKTKKEKISDLKRIEIENYISKEEYYKYLEKKEYISGIISKDRYCIVSNDKYFELDVYPFFDNVATLEIELLSENEQFEIPAFVRLIRDVSKEAKYRNSNLAKKFGKAL